MKNFFGGSGKVKTESQTGNKFMDYIMKVQSKPTSVVQQDKKSRPLRTLLLEGFKPTIIDGWGKEG